MSNCCPAKKCLTVAITLVIVYLTIAITLARVCMTIAITLARVCMTPAFAVPGQGISDYCYDPSQVGFCYWCYPGKRIAGYVLCCW